MATLAEIDALIVEAEDRLKELTDQTVWFKAQRDWWRARLEARVAYHKFRYSGVAANVKAASYALDKVYEEMPIEMEWLDSPTLLPHLVLVCDAAYDLVQSRYDYYHNHLGVLMNRNKAVMLEYNATGGRWS